MLGDIAFPGVVMLLKLFFKLMVEQEVKVVDAFKAILLFPIDIAFLSFSFGAALLYATPVERIQAGNIKVMFIFLLMFLIFIFLITMVSKKSEKLFVLNRYWLTFFCSVLSYAISLFTLYGCLEIRGYL